MQEKKQFLQRARHFGSSHFGSTLRYLFCRRACCKRVIADENMWMVTVSLVWLRDLVDGVGVASLVGSCGVGSKRQGTACRQVRGQPRGNREGRGSVIEGCSGASLLHTRVETGCLEKNAKVSKSVERVHVDP